MNLNKIIFSTALLAAVSPVVAQEQMESIIVTADRIDTPAERVGSSVSVITGEELAEKNITYVTDYLKQIPGIALYQNGGRGGVSRVFIRGAEDNHTLVLINGVEVNDPATGSAFDFAHLLAEDIEKIEVIRGSQSALWGSDAIGGVINIITKTSPDEDGVSGNYRFEYGSFDTRYGYLSSGYRNQAADFRFSVQGEESTGESVAPKGKERDGYGNFTADLSSNVYLTDQTTLSLYGRYVDGQSDFDDQDFSDPSSPTFGQLVDADNETDVDQIYTKAELNWLSENQQYEQIFGYQYIDTENKTNSEGVISEFDSDKSKFNYQLNNYRKMGSGLLEGDYTFTFAYEYEDEDYRQRGFSNQDQGNDQHGFVWQAQSAFENGLTLTGSIRYDDNDDFKDEETYRASASYVLTKKTRLHGSYGSGVKNPTFTEIYGFSPDSFIGNPGLEPEKSDSYDIGVEQKFLNDKLIGDVTFFYTELEDEIISTFDSETFLSSVDNLNSDSERKGIEVSLSAFITENWNARASYTYLDADGPDDRSELRRPDNQASLSTEYNFSKARVGLEVLYTDSSLDNDFTTVPASITRLDEFFLVNISGQYELNDSLKLTGRVENLTDEDYQTVNGFDTREIGAFVGLQGKF